ncbi:putative bifunctional diguanylate cyclase/phosphodiesterase [Methylobacterium symbioticum]|uniref:Putative signaling protein n=1 Tax=Methylobacterium symbioticum TaxID=2584084 RepID=A0A509EFK9_9HYPH|nr:EAL domain-containing protein [Methylobacterium symbioticum]VUD72404.1 putative signaling protein [Methylobacterium symbioticum]
MQPEIADLIDGELAKGWHERRSQDLCRLLRARRDSAQERQDYRAAVWVAGLLYLIFTATDALLIPDVLAYTSIARLGIWVVFVFGLDAQLRRGQPLSRIDKQCAVGVIAAYAAWLCLTSFSVHHLSASYYIIYGIIFMMVSNLFFNFGFSLAAATSGVILAGFFLALATLFPVGATYTVVVGTLYVATYLLTLFVNWKLNRERYRVFLNAVRAEIQQRKVAERGADLLRLSTTDAMTGLPNRRAIDEELRITWEAWQAGGASFGVILIDIDYFKRYNDFYGHQAGDACLTAVARAMEAASGRHGGSIGRFGGEEFIVLVCSESRDATIAIAEGIRRAVADLDLEHAQRPDRLRTVTASVGAVFSADLPGAKAERLVTEADRALYRAKASDRNCVRAFDRHDPERLDLRESVADIVRTALAQDRVSLVYQPILDARTGRVDAVETLMRLTAPGGAPISPATFIPVAERTGAIVELGRWAIRTACREVLVPGLAPRISVNVSTVQFRNPGFVLGIAEVLGSLGLQPARLAVEVTEGLEIESRPEVLQGIAELRQLGVQVWLDDFGTGFSGLSCLQTVPFDVVKVDRSFLHAAATERGAGMLRDMIGLVRNAGHRPLVEGVENVGHLDRLAGLPVDLIQGFHIGRPMPIELLRTHLRHNVQQDLGPEAERHPDTAARQARSSSR